MAWIMRLILLATLLTAGACGHATADTTYRIRSDRWTPADERGFGEFLTAIGDSGCDSVDACLRAPVNPFRASDPGDIVFRSDCADLPYVLRFYYAWKRGLPFSYAAEVSPRGRALDVRYSPAGNEIQRRRDIQSGADARQVLEELRDDVSSATYRVDPELESPDEQDFYSPAIGPGTIRPGTVIYDPNGHLALVFRIERDGRIRYIDAHPDNSLTRGIYDLRFVRAAPGMGAGFKNWRPLRLEGARASDGMLLGGIAVLTPNWALADFSMVQYYGTGTRPEDSRDWKRGLFVLSGQKLDYYDYIRARLSGGNLSFDPVAEIADMVASNCADLSYRAEAVDLALQEGVQNQVQPERLPPNIYGSDGDWETYSTPSRDARLKTAFKNLRDTAERFLGLWRRKDASLDYRGTDLPADLLATYDARASTCSLSYVRSDGSRIALSYEEARRRLFRLSFDPYQCAELRWGAEGNELATCRDGTIKRAWYAAEQRLRNQTERTYDAQMDFSLSDLLAGSGGVNSPPDTDVRAFLAASLAAEHGR
jgi:hypothetical protein